MRETYAFVGLFIFAASILWGIILQFKRDAISKEYILLFSGIFYGVLATDYNLQAVINWVSSLAFIL